MATLTLLQMVQKILSSMDSDDVTSVTETEEASQVVDIIEDTFNDLIVELNPPSINQTIQLTGLSDANEPTTFTIPARVIEIGKIKYEITDTGDADRSFRDLDYLEPQDFIDKLLIRSSGDANVIEKLSPNNTPLFFFNDQYPRWWTSFDDDRITCDAFKTTEDTTLQGSKTTVLCVRTPVFSTSGSSTPEMPEKAFPLFLAECKRACHVYLKQQDSTIDAKRIVSGKSTFKNKKSAAHDKSKKIKFGRK